ncbi:GL16834 [Drosophila persimilis]|uniref:GL16834 n=1 Tax=Drosophila persimilis TaxID=7234 RepID=B4GI28_DROPE|nr:GL16834 [Drosophila persimilis]
MRDAEPSSSGGGKGLAGQCNGQLQNVETEADSANCTICGAAKSSALLDLRSNQVMQRRLSRDWKMQDGWKWRTRLVCQHCGRAYFRKDYFIMHSRRCKSQQRLPKARCRVLNEAGSDDDTVSPRALQSSLRPTRTFHCRNCDKEFFTVISLRQHQRNTHQTRHPCSLCEVAFDTKYEWDLHHTICSAKHEARVITNFSQALKLHQNTNETNHRVRAQSTRSRSRACSEIWNKYTTNVEEEDNDSECDEQELDENEQDEQVDTMYTRRMNFTGDWIVNHSRSNSNTFNVITFLFPSTDLYMLDLLKAQVQLNEFSCFTPACGYQTDSLSELMKHDYMRHWKMSWFYCQKCGDVFTSKVFLDYHLHRQNRGVYICHKCQDEFEFQHQLDRHLVLHNKGINYQCNFCRLAFLSEAKLLAHCARCGHSPNADPPLIRIDRALSISNYPPQPETTNHKWEYEERELLLPGVATPSSRPMHLPNHKPFRFAIGICDFENRHQPNCVGCQ